MKPLPFFAVAAQQVTTHPAHVLKIEGQFLGVTADRYLQVHDSEVVAAEGAVPIKSWLINQNSPFFQSFPAGELALANGLYICISTTDATKTLSTDTMDLNVELTDPERHPGTTYVGDEIATRSSLLVWADGAGPKSLKRLIIKELRGTPGYVFLVSGGGTAVFLARMNANERREFNFGQGLVPFVIGGNGVAHNGCTVIVYEDLGISVLTNKANILAEYK